MRAIYGFGAVVLAIGAGCASSEMPRGSDSGESSTGQAPNTTIPVTTISNTTTPVGETTGGDATADDGSTGPATGSGPDTTGTTSAATTTTTTSASTGTPGTDSTTGAGAAFVEWCILQFPTDIAETTDVATTVYARLYVEGITDQSVFVDVDPMLVAEFGYGDDGSMPDEAWTWVSGAPNPGWDGSVAKGGFGNENNDEYQGELSFPAAGVFDYAARFSVDGGETWVYCDLDDLQTGGYTPDQAGNAVIE